MLVLLLFLLCLAVWGGFFVTKWLFIFVVVLAVFFILDRSNTR